MCVWCVCVLCLCVCVCVVCVCGVVCVLCVWCVLRVCSVCMCVWCVCVCVWCPSLCCGFPLRSEQECKRLDVWSWLCMIHCSKDLLTQLIHFLSRGTQPERPTYDTSGGSSPLFTTTLVRKYMETTSIRSKTSIVVFQQII